ncbi:MAG: ankyrin repeat domain-containing protein, partial [Deltaproteobacteria bacterium]|nr:ankyrin repeat domain-containing protein [Deltaproteobacteria bacterium]
ADSFVNAAENNDLHAAKLFLTAGMNPDVKNKLDSTALIEAIHGGYTAIVKELVKHKASFGGYELSRAAIRDNSEILRVMLEAGAQQDMKNEAFLFAASAGRLENMRALIDDGVDIGSIGAEALQRAAGSRFNGDKVSDNVQNDIVRFLLDLGADPNVPDDQGSSALHYSARNGFVAVTQTLLNSGAKVNGKNNDGRTPLFEALYRYNRYPPDNKSAPIVNILLIGGADVNAKDSQGKTPLMIAANFRSARIVKILLDAGARITDKDDSGKTALSYVAHNVQEGHAGDYDDIIRALQEAKLPSTKTSEKQNGR